MRNYRLIVCLIIGILLLLPLTVHKVQAQSYYEYNVEVRSDGSAEWTITLLSNANATVDSWYSFQQKVFDLIDTASNLTHREMTVDENSLQINTTTISANSIATNYSFLWQNFSVIRGNQLIIGDVFQDNNFFNQLYGDAALQLSYPIEYTVKSATPQHLQQDNELEWSSTQDLTSNPVNIVLTITNQTGPNSNNDLPLYAVVVSVSVVAIGAVLIAFYRFRHRKNSNLEITAENASPLISEEDKVLKILKSSRGSMRQSQVTEQCKFSKAKTSQLLSALEAKGRITRYKSGRDKIVTLKETGKGE